MAVKKALEEAAKAQEEAAQAEDAAPPEGQDDKDEKKQTEEDS